MLGGLAEPDDVEFWLCFVFQSPVPSNQRPVLCSHDLSGQIRSRYSDGSGSLPNFWWAGKQGSQAHHQNFYRSSGKLKGLFQMFIVFSVPYVTYAYIYLLFLLDQQHKMSFKMFKMMNDDNYCPQWIVNKIKKSKRLCK